jgi:tetratricopeptide (TPR) repeat protein
MAVELAPGLQKLVLVEGGAAAAVAPGASVRLRYAVAALDDSDGDVDQLGLAAEWRSQPAQAFSLVLGRGDALPCVEAAVLSMAPGELARFVLSDSAAGELQQLAPSLAAADTLALTIELVDATTPPRLDLAAATAHKDAGNAAFKAKDYGRAVDAYMRAIDVVDQRRQQASPTDGDGDGGGGGEQQQQQQEEVRAMATLQLDAHNNLSLCSIHTGSFAMALHHCNVVLSTDSTNAKALNRRARAYKGLHDYRSARRDCEGILSLAEERERDGQESATTATGKKAPLCAMPYQK